jgi:hypothetical protein
LWRVVYASLAARELKTFWRTGFSCVPKMTLFSSVFASPSGVRLAHENGARFSSGSCQYGAGKHGTVASLAAAYELGLERTVATVHGAAEYNELPMLQFLHAQKCPWDASIAAVLARRGKLELLRWVIEQGCPFDKYAILTSAASSGNIETTAWVKQLPKVVINDYPMTAAAGQGHTAMSEYLRTEQCPWDEQACEFAAERCHLNTLRWLHENGCPWHTDEMCRAAAAGGSIDVILYLQAQLGSASFDAAALDNMLHIAASHSKLETAVWLRQQGVQWPDVLEFWPEDMVAWARAEGCTAPALDLPEGESDNYIE